MHEKQFTWSNCGLYTDSWPTNWGVAQYQSGMQHSIFSHKEKFLSNQSEMSTNTNEPHHKKNSPPQFGAGLTQMSLVMRKPKFWFPTWSNTNQAVQLQKMAKDLKFWVYEEEGLNYLCSENKGADQLRGYKMFVFS